VNYAETSYERDDARTDRDEDADYRCPHCGELNGGHVCTECARMREKEHGDIEEALTAALAIAHEAHDARWDDDTTNVRKRLAKDLRTEMASAFFLSTGERL
jgi:hypothetical protein